MKCGRLAAALAGLCAMFLAADPARAGLVLSQLVVELQPGKHDREDVEVWNDSPNVTYVAVEPREILKPGTPQQSPRVDPDPEKLGLLVSPERIVLEPGQRKLLRIATLSPALDQERVYRVTVKPVVGQLTSRTSGLKILIGYDALVLVRPTDPLPNIVGVRSGGELVLRNDGNESVELADGRACDSSGKLCSPLTGGRLYAGAEKRIAVPPDRRAAFWVKIAGTSTRKEF